MRRRRSEDDYEGAALSRTSGWRCEECAERKRVSCPHRGEPDDIDERELQALARALDP